MAENMDKRIVSEQEYEEFLDKYGVESLKTLNSDGKKVPISELEKNALECILKAGMFVPKKDQQYEVDNKMHAMYLAIHHFMETGHRLDAFDLYCVYSGSFLNDSGDQLQNMMNFVASYENGAARLVQSHRDHYVHSAYVFILGLAIFNTQETFRENFNKIYTENCTRELCYSKFVDLWGLTALFHDIGYQYEIPFNQIRENNKFKYFVDIKHIEERPPEEHYVYFQYKNMDKFTNLLNLLQEYGLTLKNKMHYPEEYLQKYLLQLVDGEFVPKDIEDVIAYHIQRKFASRDYLDRVEIADKLRQKNAPTELTPKKEKQEYTYDVFMDHAYYSGIRLFKQMIYIYGLKFGKYSNRLAERMDAITAIVMHNKFFEFELSKKEPMQMDEHPLAYLLILCDELQCWDRTSFGKSSLKQFHALDCEFEFRDGGIIANYCFDEKNDAIQFYSNGKIRDVVAGPLKKFLINKDKKDENGKKIERYIDTINPDVTKDWNKEDCTTWHIASSDYPKGDDTRFLYSINEVVDCTGAQGKSIAVAVKASFNKTNNKYCREYLTTMSMEDVYMLASKLSETAIGKRFDNPKYKQQIWDKFFFIVMSKALGEILNAVGCFAIKEQKAFERILQWDNFKENQKERMIEIVEKHMQTYLAEYHIVYGNIYDNLDLKESAKVWTETAIKVLLEYPGLEVYRIKRSALIDNM